MTEPIDTLIDTTHPSKDERTWGMLCHISTFCGMIIPFGNGEKFSDIKSF